MNFATQFGVNTFCKIFIKRNSIWFFFACNLKFNFLFAYLFKFFPLWKICEWGCEDRTGAKNWSWALLWEHWMFDVFVDFYVGFLIFLFNFFALACEFSSSFIFVKILQKRKFLLVKTWGDFFFVKVSYVTWFSRLESDKFWFDKFRVVKQFFDRNSWCRL